MTVKEHYDNHLGDFYVWMAGDFDPKQQEQQQFFEAQQIKSTTTGAALDLGAGHGLQAVSLAKLGFTVKAIDFNQQLLAALRHNAEGLAIDIIEDDIRHIKQYRQPKPEVIVCWGDTLTHLDTKEQIRQLIQDAAKILDNNGKLILSFRDYTKELTGTDRFIPVKSDDTRILTCCLDYTEEHVTVTDILHTKSEQGWQQKVSAYQKVRITPQEVMNYLQESGLSVIFNEPVNRLITMIAKK